MSINDLLDSEVFLPAMLVIFVVVMIFAIPAGLIMSKKTNSAIYGDNEFDDYTPIKTEQDAKIVARRTMPHPVSPTVMVNMVVFQLANGSRVELAIKNPDVFGVMVEGDCGTLSYQGKKFIGFKRGGSNET